VLRSLIDACNQIKMYAINSGGRNYDQILDEATSLIFEIVEANPRPWGRLETLSSALEQALDRIKILSGRSIQGEITGITTGYVLDLSNHQKALVERCSRALCAGSRLRCARATPQ